jgi:hypothetical protein
MWLSERGQQDLGLVVIKGGLQVLLLGVVACAVTSWSLKVGWCSGFYFGPNLNLSEM